MCKCLYNKKNLHRKRLVGHLGGSVDQASSFGSGHAQFMGSSPASGSVLTARSPEAASGSVSPSPSAPPPLTLCLSFSLKKKYTLKKKKKLHQLWDTWVTQSVKRPTPAQVMISWFVGLSPASGSVLTAQSLEPASDSVSSSLSTCTMCLSQK